MKQIANKFSILLLILLPLISVSCGKPEEEVERTSVLIYIAGNNSLAGNAPDCMRQLRSGYIPSEGKDSDLLLVYYHTPGSGPKLVKMCRDSQGVIRENVLCTYPSDQVSSNAETLAKVLNDAEALCPATYHNLVLWSHSSGFLPEGHYEKLSSGTGISWDSAHRPRKSFGKDYSSSDEIELGDLTAALPFRYDCIFFDSCHMGCIEVAYELRSKCDYVVVSPTEIMAQGFPYYMMMEQLFNNSDFEAAITAVAKEYYDYYMKDSSGDGTVTVVRCAGLQPIAEFCSGIFDRYRDRISILNPGALQVYDRCRCHWLFDLGDLVQRLSSSAEYREFESLLNNNVIVYKAATPEFLTIPIRKYSGLGMYLPNPEYEILNDYYKTLLWNKDTGYLK